MPALPIAGCAPGEAVEAVHSAAARGGCDPAQQRIARYAALLRGYELNVIELARDTHPSWWSGLGEFASLVPRARRDDRRACAIALLRMYDTELPRLDQFAARSSVIAAVAPADGHRALCIRSLIARRAAVRRCIDKASRSKLIEWVGPHALELIGALHGSPEFDCLPAASLPPVSSLSSCDAAWEGLQLLRRDGEWDDTGPLNIVRMRFERSRTTPDWSARMRTPHGRVEERFDEDGSDLMFTVLPKVFTGWPW